MDDPNITMEEYIQLMADKARGRDQLDFSVIVYNDAPTSNQNVSSKPTVSIYNAIKSDIDFHISFSGSEDKDYTFIYNKDSSSYKLIPANDLKLESEPSEEVDNVGGVFINLEISKCWSLEISRRLFNTLFTQTLKMENHPEQNIWGVSSF
ncbi:hypothetical protein Tco_1113812 [Tanacetum coccineum]|uniref:Uncharacterized protein n=1 Tax=Tanacetum coccineum TaxID=301880 RepID=A0ABQ5ITD1_9ASTR